MERGQQMNRMTFRRLGAVLALLSSSLAALAGDFRFRIAHDWRDMDAMSSNLPLALVAAEDQNFASHNGFDFVAIEKAQKHN